MAENSNLDINVDSEEVDAELRDTVWGWATSCVVAIVIFIFGAFTGFVVPTVVEPVFGIMGISGPAAIMAQKVDELTERTDLLKRERDTLGRKMALIERGAREADRDREEADARTSACESQIEQMRSVRSAPPIPLPVP